VIRHSALPEYCSAPSFLAAIASNIRYIVWSRGVGIIPSARAAARNSRRR